MMMTFQEMIMGDCHSIVGGINKTDLEKGLIVQITDDLHVFSWVYQDPPNTCFKCYVEPEELSGITGKKLAKIIHEKYNDNHQKFMNKLTEMGLIDGYNKDVNELVKQMTKEER